MYPHKCECMCIYACAQHNILSKKKEREKIKVGFSNFHDSNKIKRLACYLSGTQPVHRNAQRQNHYSCPVSLSVVYFYQPSPSVTGNEE